MSAQQIVCILGMHRSGTSVVARLLNILGVDLGPAHHLMPAHPDDNPKGYWEHLPLLAINEELLARLGGSWHEPPSLRPGWERSASLSDLSGKARAAVDEDFGGKPLWGWKDPRTSLTLPFWQALLGPMTFVVCCRNPTDVQRSLARRDEEHPTEGERLGAKGSDLWLEYSTRALQHTSGAERLIVFYEDVLGADWRAELRRLAVFIGHPERAEDPTVLEEAGAFVQDGLHHHRTSLVEVTGDRGIGFPAKSVYFALRTSGAGSDPLLSVPQALDLLGRAAAESEEETRSLRDSTKQRSVVALERDGLVRENARLREQIDQVTAGRDPLIQGLFREGSRLGEQIGQLSAERDRLTHQALGAQERLNALTGERDRLLKGAGQREARLAELTAQHAAQEAEAGRLRALLHESERELNLLRSSRTWRLRAFAVRLGFGVFTRR